MIHHLRGNTLPRLRPATLRRLVARVDPVALAAFLLPLLLYTLTLAPTIYNLDSAELTTAVATDGIVRATGYPLYLLLGKLWSWLPIGDVGYRLNLFSALCGAATILLLDRTLRRLQIGPWARFGALGLLATAPYFWALSLIAEVYTLHTALMAGTLLLLLRWAEKPGPRRLAWPILLATLSLGNHAATVLLLPGYVFFVLATHPRQLTKPRVWLAGLLALLAGASIFLLLPLRYTAAPAFNYAGRYDATGAFIPVDLTTIEGIWWLLSGKTFSGQMFAYRLNELWPQVAHFGRQLWAAFFAIGLTPALLGIVHLARPNRPQTNRPLPHRPLLGLLLLAFLANTIFYVNYRVVDKSTMFLPAFVVWAIWLAVGYHVLINWLEDTRTRARPLLYGIIGGAVLLALLWNWTRVDLSHDWSTREQSEAILQQVQEDAIIFGWWETAPALQYLQLVEGRRPDVTIINRFLISGPDMAQLIRSQLGRRPVYINNPSIELLRTARASAVGPLYLLEPLKPNPGDSGSQKSSRRLVKNAEKAAKDAPSTVTEPPGG